MDMIFLILGFSNIFSGILVIAVCIPLLRNKIGINRWYGFRFRKSFSSDEHWYAINRYGARRMILWSFVIIAIGIFSLTLSTNDGDPLRIIMAGASLLLIIPAIESWIFAKKLDRRNAHE
jgi:hypothetical protein